MPGESIKKHWSDGALSNPWSKQQHTLKLALITLGLTVL